MKEVKRIAVTGGGGQIGYSLLFRIAAGDLLGKDQPIELCMHDIEENVSSLLKGVAMELEDSCYPLLKKIVISSNLETVFEGVDIAILVGAKPRGPGMQRKDLIQDNAAFFRMQGHALNCVGKQNALVFVVGNPCNTNCLIALHHAPNLCRNNFHAMTRLDQNRAVFQLSEKAQVDFEKVKKVAVWGNHSNTLVVDCFNAEIDGKPLLQKITDTKWLENEFLQIIQQRGAEIIKMRKKSSAASATQAILDGINSILSLTEKNNFYSSSVLSDHNPYGIEEDLIFSFPIKTDRNLSWKIVTNLKINSFLEEKIKISEKELILERDAVAHLLK